eukprot:gene2585-3546_t
MFVFLLVFCWSLTEMLRSLFYITKEINVNFYLLLFIRYSLFIILYPVGVISEIYLVISQMNLIFVKRPFSIFMPNDYNIAFDSYYFTFIFLFGYFYAFPLLYKYMLKQRNSKLFKDKKKS